MKDAVTYLLEGLWLMRRAPGLFLALITASAALSHYASGPGAVMVGVVFSMFYYYWNMSLAVQQLRGQGRPIHDFLRIRPAAFVAMILYPFFALFWSLLICLPIWMAGSLIGASMLGQEIGGDPEVAARAALASREWMWMFAAMLLVIFIVYFRFLSNRITVPIAAALWDMEMGDADKLAGPRSRRRFPVLFWIFAIPSIPVWMLMLFSAGIISPESGAYLILDFLLAFSTALPIVAATAYVSREVDPASAGAPGA